MIKLFGPSYIIDFDELLEVVREGTSIPQDVEYVDGKPVKVDPVCFMVTCNVQPIQGRDLMLVPEMDRGRENYWLFTNNCDVPLQVNDRVNRKDLQTNSTLISYQVQECQNWGSFQQVRLMRIDIGKNAADNSSN